MHRICIGLVGFCLSWQVLAHSSIVAFLGNKRVGKDSAANVLINELQYERYSIAERIKKASALLFNFDYATLEEKKDIVDPFWGMTPRDCFRLVGIYGLVEGMKTFNPAIGDRYNVMALSRDLQDKPNAKIVISDLRLQGDLNGLKAMGTKIIRIVRPSIDDTANHPIENTTNVTGEDLTIVNDGTLQEFEAKVRQAMIDMKISG